ncbi:Glycosyltransferase [Olavius sp. associated proteobacterium Delta 1]|nr:Glycosyltransferase [Olavius sp. associated proteobacterium Delta 1]
MISVVIPAYNETGNINPIAQRVSKVLENLGPYEIIFVDDGSMDGTLGEIKELNAKNKKIKFISFSRNFGHQKALKAGLDHARGDCVISMDADLQHPPELLTKLIEEWRKGYDVVYTVRVDSADTAFIKKLGSRLFYKIINLLSNVNIPLGAADFRLLDKKVVDEVKKFQENWLFIRGIVAWIGFNQTSVEYVVNSRTQGRTKYSASRMLALAIDGITSFSILPLRISIILGLTFSLGSFFYSIYAIYAKVFSKAVIRGWTSILLSVLFLGGIQLISLGVIGEYLGKMFIEIKNRPAYIIKEKDL